METSGRNKWLNSFVRIASGNAKTDDDPIYIVYRQQNGWCTLHNIKDSSCKIVKQCELTRIKLVRICLPLQEVERVLKCLETNMDYASVYHFGYAESWENLYEKLRTLSSKNIIIQIINSKYPDNLYFSCNSHCALYPGTKDSTIAKHYFINLTKLLYRSEKNVHCK